MATKQLTCRLLASAALLACASSAGAVPVPHTYNFTASGFGAGAPVDPIVGSITATFDEAAVGSGSIDAITLSNGAHVFTVGEVGFEAFGSGIAFGGTNCAITCITHGTDDFWLTLNGFTANDLNSANFAYSYLTTQTGSFFSAPAQVTDGGSVPEPGTIVLLGLGLFGFAVARRRTQ